MTKATELIKSEHREVEELFDRFEQSPGRDVAERICQLLDRHTEMEEQILYPELQKVDEGLYADAKDEHGEADNLIEQIRNTDDLDRISELVSELQDEVAHHVEDEETEDLPAMDDACGAERMDDLGDQMAQWKHEKESGSDETEALLDLTKDELYEKAQAADIQGRSQMTKDELAQALAQR
jgi:iron-sulfur cluster repair protein YtfE (RIC family)